MWTTLDGYKIFLPQTRLRSIALQLRQPGLLPLLRRHYGDNLRQAVSRSISQLARNARCAGALRNVATGSRFLVFKTRANGNDFQIIAQPVGGVQNAIVSLQPSKRQALPEEEYMIGDPAPPPNEGDTGNIFHWLLINKIVNEVKKRGWKDVRVDQVQTARGRVAGLNRPDVQAIDRTGRRVIVEVDTDPNQSDKHQKDVIKANPAARSIFVLIDPKTGKVIKRHIYNPKT